MTTGTPIADSAGEPVICFVTPGRSAAEGPLLSTIAAAARAGVGLIQIREPHLTDRALLALVRAAIEAAAGTAARIVVNDRLDIALAAGAAGVHLRASSFPAAAARTIVPAGFIVGRSVHTAAEAEDAERVGGCDYLVFGTVFASGSKPAGHPVAGLEALRAVCSRVALPVLAIGGITPETAARAYRAGAAGVAGIGIFSGGTDLPASVARLRHAFDSRSEAV